MEDTKILPRGTRQTVMDRQKRQIKTVELRDLLDSLQMNEEIKSSAELQSASMHLQLALIKIKNYNSQQD